MNGINMTHLVTLDRPGDVHQRFARTVADEITTHNALGQPTRLILPVGPTAHYPLLADLCNREQISWQHVHIVMMDEYLDWRGRLIPEDHPYSFRGFFQRFLASLHPALTLPPDQCVFPDPFDIDRAERFVADIGGIDTCYGGIGVHGHVAFNEPPISRFTQVSIEEFAAAPTRVVQLAPETIVMNATRTAGGTFDDFPPMAVTVGMRDILAASRIRLFCDGGIWQQEALHQALHGPMSIAYPVTLLCRHPDVEIIADRISAAKVHQ